MWQQKYQHDFNEVRCHPEALEKIPHGKKVFVCSMGDLFHEDVPFDFICDCFEAMSRADNTYIILTKRPNKMKEFFQTCEDWDPTEQPNIWLGVSIENQQTADERIPILLQIPAKVRFVSVEPMLGQVSLAGFDGKTYRPWLDYKAWKVMISWVICGCESGQNRRPTKTEWIMDLRNQCVSAGVPFFLKQMDVGCEVAKMPMLDGKVYDEYPIERKIW